MRKNIKLIAFILSFSMLIAGCKGNSGEIVVNDLSEQDIDNNEVVDEEDGEIKYDKDLNYQVHIETNVITPSSDDNNEEEKTSDGKENETNNYIDEDDLYFVSNVPETDDPERKAYMNFNYDEVDTKGLSNETLNLFSPCAIYLTEGGSTANGDLLSSKDYKEIYDFLFDFLNFAGAELIQDFGDNPDMPRRIRRMQYEEWDYLIRNVLNDNPDIVRDKLPNAAEPEVTVFYNPDDNYIYTEMGALGWEETAVAREVIREGDAYIITYDCYWGGCSLTGVAEVTIAEADNKYGYSLVSIERLKNY